jgi:hypothetical protein
MMQKTPRLPQWSRVKIGQNTEDNTEDNNTLSSTQYRSGESLESIFWREPNRSQIGVTVIWRDEQEKEKKVVYMLWPKVHTLYILN